jgi:hypothetical protein
VPRYAIAYRFCSTPIERYGLSYSMGRSSAWARDTADRMSEARIEAWIRRYQIAVEHALTPIWDGGLSYAGQGARAWAIQMSNQLDEDELLEWIDRYGRGLRIPPDATGSDYAEARLHARRHADAPVSGVSEQGYVSERNGDHRNTLRHKLCTAKGLRWLIFGGRRSK